jgi:hypothetical protein
MKSRTLSLLRMALSPYTTPCGQDAVRIPPGTQSMKLKEKVNCQNELPQNTKTMKSSVVMKELTRRTFIAGEYLCKHRRTPILVSEGPHNVLLGALSADFMALSKLLYFAHL